VSVDESKPDPVGQSEVETLQAELREALQHQRAALERVQETQVEVEALMRRARDLLARIEGSGVPPR
jgi:hypothetical protein